MSNVIAMHDAGKLHKACASSPCFNCYDLQVLGIPGKTERFSQFFASFLGLSMLSTEFILGLPLKQTGIYPGIPEGPHHVIQYGMTLVLSSHDSR